MADSPASESSAHLRSFASLLQRIEQWGGPLRGPAGALAGLRAQYTCLRDQHSLEVTAATFRAKDLQCGAPGSAADSERAFQLGAPALDVCEGLAALAERALATLQAEGGRPLRRAEARRAVSDVEHQRAEIVRALQQLLEHVRLAALGQSRGARSAWPAPLELENCDDCGAPLNINSGRSEKSCPRCARVYEVYGVVYEESQMYSQEGQRSRSGCFSPSQHYKEWITNILALEPESCLANPRVNDDTPAEVIERLRAAACAKNKFLALLTVADVRLLLKAIDRTDLNQHTSLLLKKLTGCGPPAVPERRRVQGYTMFSQVLSVLARLPQSCTNRSYYPYYTAKIYDLMLPRGDPCRRIFAFIHLQSIETLRKNDEQWKTICAALQWAYRPTDPATIRVR